MQDSNPVELEILPPHEILDTFENINVAAPMVRFSKLPFRELVSLYDVQVTHTPMILATEFSRSSTARTLDFSTSLTERGSFLLNERTRSSLSNASDNDLLEGDRPAGSRRRQRRVRGSLIAQFAASDPKPFADACELIYPYVDGVDLNCGCPQSWAFQEHIGSWLLGHPERVRDLVRAAKDRLGFSYPVSVKIRVDPDLQRTHQLVETALHAGVSHITVHGRTKNQKSSHPVSLSSIAFAVEVARGRVPVVANGDAWSLPEVETIRKTTGAQGVMSARGLLGNPALFSGYDETPPSAIKEFVRLSTDYGLMFPLFHRHIGFMLESRFNKLERLYWNTLPSYASVLDYLTEQGIDLDL
ncbi:FMN-linked oxidoreductase [Sistotremastrum suecicum HHB10207 ss-3]|uniref:tRNA-dihydrouridine synthase n=1 Tax=Sistotremastrum suecicum HHB10207 ss-3 TaxID=1314776 RepID=A0A166C7S3_9AGAM|nr:FMN-linked oxidoreductase [Sistotremastrum suecicum HHB10207 ss-3]